ncbi:MAG: gas vesicle protein [Deltaproteobacteria bacterium]|nr:gas vesicle protein [Deltaproteobacteria bacterium]
MQHSTHGESLADVVERVLDKGLVINADIVISLCQTELISIKLRAAIASFETAAKWGLAFPSDTRINAPVSAKV